MALIPTQVPRLEPKLQPLYSYLQVRDAGAPQANPDPAAIETTAISGVGEIDTVTWGFAQPIGIEKAKFQADGFILAYEDADTPMPTAHEMKLSIEARSALVFWPATAVRSYAIAAYRNTWQGEQRTPFFSIADWQGVDEGTTPGGGGGVTDHGALTGLLDDDHPQYLLLAGRNYALGPFGNRGQLVYGSDIDGPFECLWLEANPSGLAGLESNHAVSTLIMGAEITSIQGNYAGIFFIPPAELDASLERVQLSSYIFASPLGPLVIVDDTEGVVYGGFSFGPQFDANAKAITGGTVYEANPIFNSLGGTFTIEHITGMRVEPDFTNDAGTIEAELVEGMHFTQEAASGSTLQCRVGSNLLQVSGGGTQDIFAGVLVGSQAFDSAAWSMFSMPLDVLLLQRGSALFGGTELETTVAITANIGDTILTLTDSSNFTATGVIFIFDRFYSYTANNIGTGELTLTYALKLEQTAGTMVRQYPPPQAQVHIQPNPEAPDEGTRISLIIQGDFAQTANLTEWWDSSEGVRASMSDTGALTALRATLTQATGTAPLTVSSTTLVTNLNADMLDGFHAADLMVALDPDLVAIAALAGTGIAVRTAADTWALRTLTAPAAGLTISNPAGVAGNPTFALADDLAALEAMSGTGLAVRTGTSTWDERTIVAPAAGISIADGDGVAGNPTLSLANDLAALEGLGSTGIAVRSAADTWVQRTLQAPAAGFTITNPAGVAGDPTFVLANDLAALEALAGAGFSARTGVDTWATRTLVPPAAGLQILNPSGILGDPSFAFANDLAALEALGSTGIACRTALDTWAQRSIAAGSSKVSVTNPAGIAGDPTLDVVEANLTLSSIGGSVTDAQVPDTITLSNISQITTRSHASLQNLTADDHTIYALLAGRSGGQTLIGGTAASEDLILQSTANATRGMVKVTDILEPANLIQQFPSAFTITCNTASPNARDISLISSGLAGITLAGTNAQMRGVLLDGTVTLTGTAVLHYAFGFAHFFDYVNSGAVNPGNITGFGDWPTVTADTTVRTLSNLRSFISFPSFSVTNGGTLAVTVVDQFYAQLFSVGAGVTVTTRNAFHVYDSFSVGGTLTTQIGLKIDDLTSAGTDWSMQVGSAQSYHVGSMNFGTAAAVAAGHLVVVEGILGAKQGSAADRVKVGGTVFVSTAATGNVGAGEDDLIAHAVAAATLGTNGDYLEFGAAGTITNTVNAKRIRVKFGATTLLDTGAAGIPVSAAIDWQVRGAIFRTGAATQKAICAFSSNNATIIGTVDYTTPAETLSGAVTLKLTGEAVSNNDIVQEMMVIQWMPNNT